MRQRRVKKRSLFLQLCSNYIFIGAPDQRNPYEQDVKPAGDLPKQPYIKETFKESNGIPVDKPLYLEIGSGKGRFITELAAKNPGSFYLACEGGLNINVRILQKAQELGLDNLKVITEYITIPTEWFPENSLDGIYLNFSDPWPKDRHAHRRLTYHKMLEGYKAVAKPGAVLQFKTDNDDLFEWSLTEFETAGLKTLEISRDLWNSQYAASNIMTEYEEKFGSNGKTINYIKLQLK